METAMSNKVRSTSGKFAPKSEIPRKVRSVNLTDDAWQWLATVAEKAGMSRNDYLEAFAESNIPLMETVNFQPQPFMETVKTEIEVGEVNIEKQPDSELFPLMETVQADIESFEQQLRSQSRRLEEQDQELLKLHEWNEDLELEVQNLKEQLEKERADREGIETELSEKKQNSAPAATLFEKLTPDAATILSQLRAKRKKSSATLADIEAILEMIEES